MTKYIDEIKKERELIKDINDKLANITDKKEEWERHLEFHKGLLAQSEKKQEEYLESTDRLKNAEDLEGKVNLGSVYFNAKKYEEAYEIFTDLDAVYGYDVLHHVNSFSKEDLLFINTIYAKLTGYYMWGAIYADEEKLKVATQKYDNTKAALIQKYSSKSTGEKTPVKKVVHTYDEMTDDDRKETSDKLVKDIADICNILSDCLSDLRHNKGKLDKGKIKELKRAKKEALRALKLSDNLWADIRGLREVYDGDYYDGERNEDDFEKYAILPHDSWLVQVRKMALSVGGFDIKMPKKRP